MIHDSFIHLALAACALALTVETLLVAWQWMHREPGASGSDRTDAIRD